MNFIQWLTIITFCGLYLLVFFKFKTKTPEGILGHLLFLVFCAGCAGFFVWISAIPEGALCTLLFVGLGLAPLVVKFFNIIEDTSVLTKKEIKNRVTGQISRFLKDDSNFSRPVFLDYAQMLFLKTHYSITDEKKIKEVEPYFEYDLKKLPQTVYSHVVVENAEITDIKYEGGKCNVSVDFSAYFAAKYKQTVFHCKAVEVWKFSRKAGTLSSVPNGFGVIRCPKCGGFLSFEDYGRCPRCGTNQNYEAGQWVVSEVRRPSESIRQIFPEKALAEYNDETKQPLPSIVSGLLKNKEHDFYKIQNYKFMNFRDFENRVAKPYFKKIYKNFSDKEWNKTRHLIYENLWQNMNLQLLQYKDLGYKRTISDLEVTETETVSYERDNFYQSLTVRIFAECYDYVINYEDGIIGGSNREKRHFSQYWKFVSAIGYSGKFTDPECCPNCGKKAEDVDNSGLCPYCMTRVNDGSFSWILFSVTEDKDYCG